jgi:hypothetical protein
MIKEKIDLDDEYGTREELTEEIDELKAEIETLKSNLSRKRSRK